MQRFAGHRLREARLRAGMPKELVAVHAGRSYSSIVLYERGTVAPPLAVLCRLADVLGCDPADFFEEADRVAS